MKRSFLNVFALASGNPPDHSRIVMANGPALALTILGATLAGTAMPLNPAHHREEFRAYFQRLAISGLVLDGNHPGAERRSIPWKSRTC